MGQIKSGKLDMRSRWLYVAKKVGLRSGLALSLVVLAFLFNIFFYYIKANNLLLSLHSGASTWQEVLHSLPYDLILFILLSIFCLNCIIKKFDFSYKKPFTLVSAFFIGVAIWIAIILFASNFNSMVRFGLSNGYYVPYFRHFYIYRCPMTEAYH